MTEASFDATMAGDRPLHCPGDLCRGAVSLLEPDRRYVRAISLESLALGRLSA